MIIKGNNKKIICLLKREFFLQKVFKKLRSNKFLKILRTTFFISAYYVFVCVFVANNVKFNLIKVTRKSFLKKKYFFENSSNLL